jgi:hypothetical protein
MNAAQALAHCSAHMEVMLGLKFPPRSLIGRLVGCFAKSEVLNEKPIRRDMPTDKSFVVSDEWDLVVKRQWLSGLINRLVECGPVACTKHPPSPFGPMTSEEWARLMYKHLDHHLRSLAFSRSRRFS